MAGREQVRRLDLNLLLAFESLIAERSVTRAAARMSVGQPAMSASLARLRAFFGDHIAEAWGQSCATEYGHEGGVWHWRVRNRAIGGPISSSQLVAAGGEAVLVDPVRLAPQAMAALPRPTATCLTA